MTSSRRCDVGLLEGKKALVLGVANKRSIAWGIATALHREGADLVGKGHGPALLREFVRLAMDRYDLDYCVIGPTKTNVSAIRAYEKAGFRYLKEYREDDTSDPPHVLLDIHRRDLA